MNLEFAIPSWAACGPGLSTPDQWREWSGAPAVPVGLPQPELSQVPAMVRRRLNLLGRTALQPAFDVHTPAPDVPVVFASRYGDAHRSLDLLGALVRGEALSPTAFGLSVHNAIGAMYSLIRGDHANYVSVAAGPATVPAALVEAAGLLADGAPEVLVVYCDAPLPGGYAAFEEAPSAMYAWAWRMTAPSPGQSRYRLSAEPAPADTSTTDPLLPLGLAVMQFLAASATRFTRVVGGTAWTWQCGHA